MLIFCVVLYHRKILKDGWAYGCAVPMTYRKANLNQGQSSPDDVAGHGTGCVKITLIYAHATATALGTGCTPLLQYLGQLSLLPTVG